MYVDGPSRRCLSGISAVSRAEFEELVLLILFIISEFGATACTLEWSDVVTLQNNMGIRCFVIEISL